MNVQDQPHVKMTERRSLTSIRRPTQDGPVSERPADAPVPYQGFDGQYINGSWRPGTQGGVQIDTVSMRSAPSPQSDFIQKR
jgi:hypothetical protein